MNRRSLFLTLIPLVVLAACGPDPDDGPNSARGSSTETTGVTGSSATEGSTQTSIAEGSGNDQTTDTGVTGSTNGSATDSTTIAGSSGSSGSTGSGNAGGATGSGGSTGSGGAAGSGGSGGSTDSTLPGGATGGSGGTGSGDAAPTTTLPRDKVALDINAQTAYGFGVGPASTTDVLATVSSRLGAVTNDTGWYTLPPVSDGGVGDCLANQESRILRWGDLSIAFWRKAGVESIWSWSVGDPSVSGYGDRREPNIPASPTPTGLRTTEDIGVGSTFDDVAEAYKQRFQFFPLTPEDTTGVHVATAAETTPAGAAMSMLELGGPIIGIGSTLHFC